MTSRESLFNHLSELRALRSTVSDAGSPQGFEWPRYVSLIQALTDAPFVAVIDNGGERLSVRAAVGIEEVRLASWLAAPETRAFFQRVADSGYALRAESPGTPLEPALAALTIAGTEGTKVLVMSTAGLADGGLKGLIIRGALAAEFPKPQSQADASISLEALSNDGSLTSVLGVLADALQARAFQVAGYTVVNGLVGALEPVDQAVLGWREGAYMRVQAISHYEKFERKTEVVRLMEAALEESGDQDAIIEASDPDSPQTPGLIDVAHRQLRLHLGAKSVVTVPLHDESGETIAALLLVSFASVIPERVMSSAFFVAQTAAGHLKNLDLERAGLLIRVARAFRRGLAGWFGGENLWVKVALLAMSALIIGLAVTPITHHVTGTARFVTDQTRLITAPWSGVIDQVRVTSGDQVAEGAVVVVMDTEERLLQMAELQAELQRVLAEQDRARAEFNTVDTAVAEARVAQARARILQVQRQINQAQIVAPLSGVIVEGDRRDLVSLPVNQGDPLMRVAQIEQIYLSIEIPEEDVQFIEVGSTGDFSLVARPSEHIPLTVTRLIPMAQFKEGAGAVFAVNAALNSGEASWWRPGMTGVARIDAGSKSALWVVGRKAWNRLRLWLWW